MQIFISVGIEESDCSSSLWKLMSGYWKGGASWLSDWWVSVQISQCDVVLLVSSDRDLKVNAGTVCSQVPYEPTWQACVWRALSMFMWQLRLWFKNSPGTPILFPPVSLFPLYPYIHELKSLSRRITPIFLVKFKYFLLAQTRLLSCSGWICVSSLTLYTVVPTLKFALHSVWTNL